MSEDSIFEAQAVSLGDDESEAVEYSPLVNYVTGQYYKAKTYRRTDEDRWLRAYRNYRGVYGPEAVFSDNEKSKVFIKITKTKVIAAYAQIVEVLFGNGRFPITIEPTVLPEGVSESVHFDVGMPPDSRESAPEEDTASPYGFPGDGKDPPAGATGKSLKLGMLEEKLSKAKGLKEGEGATAASPTFYPALESAKKMQKKIIDQLEESHASKHLRSTAFEMSLFGTGVLKGPFAINKEYPKWSEDGEYDPTIKTVPQISHVSVWNFYPDPDANNIEEAEYVIERHKMSRSQLRALKKRPMFRNSAIDDVISYGEAYVREHWEDDLADYDQQQQIERFEVLEYWGNVDTELLESYDIDIPEGFEDFDEVQANIWVVNNEIIRLVLNPFKPMRIPYAAAPYELNPYSFFGVGVGENMEDTQTLMNGFMRMAVDNGALSGNLLIEVDETNLVPGQDLTVYPGKVFRRQGGAPGQSIFGTKFPNVSQENLQMFDKARQLADESTGMPSFAHGQTGVSGVGRTASGISMLMGAASITVKSVIKNVDDYLLKPVGDGLFHFNMQFDNDKDIKGDLEVRARGTESLMANEVRSQRLMQFLGIASNQVLAPFAKFNHILAELAKSLDLDPDKVVNSMDDALLQAEILKGMQAEQAQQQPQPNQTPAGTNPQVPTAGGGGTIGAGPPNVPGQEGFSGNAQPQQQQAQPSGGAAAPPPSIQ